MKIAFVLFEGFSNVQFAALFDPLTQLPGLEWDVVSRCSEVYDSRGLHFYPTRITDSLAGYPMVVVPGGLGAAQAAAQPEFVAWLRTADSAEQVAGVGEGVLLLAAAGLLRGHEAALPSGVDAESLICMGARPAPPAQGLVLDGPALTAVDARSAFDLGQVLLRGLLHPEAAPFHAIQGASGQLQVVPRTARVERTTQETQVQVSLNLEGKGHSKMGTGLPFLDHMLTQIAVHGLMDLEVAARGDLQVDPHHTMEDVALSLGEAFRLALGDRAGIVRMASFEVPMDESLARVTLDFSGRPYCVFNGEWTLPSVGGLPNTLFVHFFESFAVQARCNLHVQILYGRDDHHKTEAIFKAFGRALDAACRVDPRRGGGVPSSKGVLV